MIEKYGTYKIYKNKETKEVIRLPLTDAPEDEIFKQASLDKKEWVELGSEDEVSN